MNASLPFVPDVDAPAPLEELAAAVNLKATHLPEGYVSIGGPAVRLHRLPGMRISTQTATITADEADAWAELFKRAAEEARAQVEEQRAEEAREAEQEASFDSDAALRSDVARGY